MCIYDCQYMHIEVTVFDADGRVIRNGSNGSIFSTVQTIDTESGPLLEQLEQISPCVCWNTLAYVQWRGGVRIHEGVVYRSQGDNNEADKPMISAQLDYLRRNWTIDMEKSNADRATLEIRQKFERTLENQYLVAPQITGCYGDLP
jgi:hypothetical protein